MGIGVHSCTYVAKYSCIAVVTPSFLKDMGIGVHYCPYVAKYSCIVVVKPIFFLRYWHRCAFLYLCGKVFVYSSGEAFF